ncbi:N-acetyltransferase [Arthrobacter zhangbolii]|uniref:N-acetyltransferase n=1 Tax=Arthrobacter zhangbolii TaxID=2886936 RepID=A0A9X1M9V0_9MICC|nr:N-acetyltransferase [Arthrobacter zhangbolii]MCC3274104.1 N-acetyltransferase [Arthrobacter zhangbolii]UON92895.1 N-acetyltransferase [Arthrobacter zhangbolii]
MNPKTRPTSDAVQPDLPAPAETGPEPGPAAPAGSRGRAQRRKPAPKGGKTGIPNATVYNNRLHSRFELFVNGTMAAYLQYEMHGGELWALRIIVDPAYRQRTAETLLIEEVLADARRSRIALLPFCPRTRAYVAARPEYLPLIPRQHRARFAVSATGKRTRLRPGAGPVPG